ncbi:MAG: citrate/2-methylcitrate synthase [Pseudomonadales bacterium]
MSNNDDKIISYFWQEQASEDNPFAAASCHCAGFNVYNEVLQHANWIEYLFLLFRHQQPSQQQAALLNALAIALANPGPRDASVQAAMSGAAGGSTFASCLMAAIATGAGNLGGSREVMLAMQNIEQCGAELDKWQQQLLSPPQQREDVWLPMEHPPGFDPLGVTCSSPVQQTLQTLAELSTGKALRWLYQYRQQLEAITQCPLAMSGVAAAALIDLDFHPQQGEMLFLLLRLPGAAAHALEQYEIGLTPFPFFADGLDIKGTNE